MNDTAIPILASSDIYTVVKTDEVKEVFNSKRVEADTASLGASNFKAGDQILDSSIYLSEKFIGNLALISGSDYTVPVTKTLVDNVIGFFSSIKVYLLYAAIVLIILIILLFTIRFINLRRR